MKRLVLSLLLLPVFLLGQEREQKERIRQGMVPAPIPSPQRSQTPPAREQGSSEYDQKRYYRGSNKPVPNQPPTYQPPRRYYYDPYWDWNFGGWGWNRWNRWGAPGWYDNWIPYSYYDNWGYRQPARIYVQENGKVDTVKGVSPKISVGLQINQLEAGGFFTIGRKTYFLAEYQHTYKTDKSKYYPDLTRDVVLPWNDKQLSNITKGGTFFLGVGQRFKRTGVHAALGFVKERVRYQYYDELFVLSNNGNYSFPSYTDDYLSMKIGVLHDVKAATIKADYELTRNLFTIGVGVNF